MSCYILQHYYILQIDDWISVCPKTQQGSRGAGMVVDTSSPQRLLFQKDHASLLFLSFLAGDSGISLALPLIPRYCYEMMLPTAFDWCLVWSSNSSYYSPALGKTKQNKTQSWETFSSPVWHLFGEQSKGAHFITPTCRKGKAFLFPYNSIIDLVFLLLINRSILLKELIILNLWELFSETEVEAYTRETGEFY